jgi:hypothetical protein
MQSSVGATCSALIEPKEPVRFHHDEGSRVKGDIGTTWALRHLVSDRFILALDRFSGWRTYPVEVYEAGGELIAGNHGLAVTGRCGRSTTS